MTIEEEILKKSRVNFAKLEEFGFIKEDSTYIYHEKIQNEKFEVILEINRKGETKGKVIDLELGDEYLNYRIENQIGEFASNIRNSFESVLERVRENCFITELFLYPQSNRIAGLVKKEYQIEPEFLWKNDSKNAVFRNATNKKWFGIIMNINKSKLTSEEKNIEVLNVKVSKEKISSLITRPGYYKAYHMNKNNWITIILDETLSDQEIFDLVKESYNYTIKNNDRRRK